MSGYPKLDDLDPAEIRALNDGELASLVADLAWTLGRNAASGLLDGALELMDAQAVVALRDALWAGESNDPINAADPDDLTDQLDDAELQSMAAFVFQLAAERGAPAFARLCDLDPDENGSAKVCHGSGEIVLLRAE